MPASNLPRDCFQLRESLFDAFFDQFSDLYWTKREDAEKRLAELKAIWEEKAREGERYISQTDPELAKRMDECRCTQEDIKLPHYRETSEAHKAVNRWKWTREFIVGSWSESSSVTRLNTLPSENNWAGEEMRNEIDQKIKWFGFVTVGWSCTGHTRARWQTAAVCDWVKEKHPEWKVKDNEYDCTITAKR